MYRPTTLSSMKWVPLIPSSTPSAPRSVSMRSQPGIFSVHQSTSEAASFIASMASCRCLYLRRQTCYGMLPFTGIMPVPVPATADLLRHAPIYQKHAQTELVTPTGAAILAAVVNRFGPMPPFSSDRIGYGAGTKQFPDFPNCLRLMIGEETAVPPDRSSRSVVVLEANIDDMTPQNFGYVTEKLFAAGALDVLTIPVQMKKGRPGHLLQVLAERATSDALSKIIFHETTTIGIRRHAVDRTTLERQFIEVETTYGKVKIKVSKLDGEVVNAAPEYEDCARIAREADVPLKQVQAAAMKSYLNRENAG